MTTVDGTATSQDLGAGARPVFATVAEERLHRKQELAAAFRLFGRFGFSEAWPGTSLRATRSSLTGSGSTRSA